MAARSITESSPAAPTAALISADADLIERVGDAAAAAGWTLALPENGSWASPRDARAVLIGVDAVPDLARSPIGRSGEALVVGPDDQLAVVWRAAGDLGAAGAVSLPSGSPWLVQWLHGRAAEPGRGPRPTVVCAVFSAAGGVGSSTLAAALSVTAGRYGLHPLLIDTHPGPAGVDLLLGETTVPDHWSRFAAIRGFLPPDALQDLPILEGVRCLGWGGSNEVPLWEGALGSVLAASRRDHDLVVLDCGLNPVSLDELPRRTRPVLVVPASWRGVLAAQSRLTALRLAFEDPPVVVLRDVGGRTDPRAWAEDFDDALVLQLAFDPSAIDDEEQCRPPGTRSRSAVSKVSRLLLASLAERPVAA